MHRKILTIALAVLALALAVSPALAAKAPHRYSPKHGQKCRKHYKREKHGKKVYCVREKPAPKKTPPPLTTKVKLHAHLDPTFTRDPLDPFKVTYAYSASASEQTFTAAALAVGAEEPAPLPSGVLSFYSDGKLECAINVGSGVSGSECPVTYQALGEHRVTTIYTSGEQSATETESEQIGPLGTTTTLSVSYTPLQTPTEVEPATGLYHLGDLAISIDSTPQGVVNARLGCGEGSLEHLTASGCYQIEGTVEDVYGQATGPCNAPYLSHLYISDETERSHIAGDALSVESVEVGVYHLRASTASAGGYSASEASEPLKFKVESVIPPDC